MSGSRDAKARTCCILRDHCAHLSVAAALSIEGFGTAKHVLTCMAHAMQIPDKA